MKSIHRKMFRDLLHMRGQATAIALVIVAGVATYVSMNSVSDALQRTLAAYYRDYRFADGFASVRRAPEALKARLRAVPGVSVLETRVTAQVNLQVPGFPEPVSGELVSLPEGRQPELNRLFLREGRLVRAGHEEEVLLNEAFAQAQHLAPGAHLTAIINGRRRVLTVVGVALSPEFLMQIQPGTVFPDPQRYGVLWMGRDALAAAYDMTGAFNDVAFTIAPGANPDDVIDQVDHLLAPYGGQGAMPRKYQPSNFFIHEEFRQLGVTSTVLPAIFLAVAVFLLNVVVSRLITLQREQVGILKAFGYTDLAVGAHYLELILMVALLGAAAGTAIGLWLGRLMGDLYLEYYHFPFLDYGFQPGVVLRAALLTTGAAASGALLAVRRAVRLPPAIAMRPATPPTYRTGRLERLGLRRLLDQPTRIVLRNLARRPLRAGLTVVGIASSCAILIMGLFFGDSLDYIVRVQYGLAQREDLAVSFTGPASASAVNELAALPGVQRSEPARSVPVRLRHENRRYDTTIEGVSPDAYLRRAMDASLHPIRLPGEGLVLTERLAQVLRLAPGELVSVEVREGDRRTRDVPVVGLTRQYIGISAYMDLAALERLTGSGHAVSGAYLAIDPRQEAGITAALQRRPRVAGITSQERSISALMESYKRSMLTMAFILSLFAGVIAFGVVYNSARIALSERDRELASLRVLGFTRGEVSYILLAELALLTLAALPLGFVLGAITGVGVASATATDLYQMPFMLYRGTVGLAALIVLLAALASAVIVRRRLDRLDLVGVLKTRE